MNQGKQDSQNSQNHQEPEGPIIPQDPERPGPGWARLMERQENQYHAWNTLVGTTAIGELTITPLTDERQLFEEARIMMHAVFAYGPRCASGISRIFSLNRGGQPDSTMELVPREDQWVLAQIRGPRNARPPKDSHDAALRIADQYTQAWRNTPDHNSWQVPDTG